MFTSTGGAIVSSIIVPSTITSFGSSAFFGQESLSKVTFVNGLTVIGKDAFDLSGFPSAALTSVIIPSSVTSVGKSDLDTRLILMIINYH